MIGRIARVVPRTSGANRANHACRAARLPVARVLRGAEQYTLTKNTVKWQDLDTRFPASFVGDIDGAASHVARLALGLPVRGVTRDGVLHTVRQADNWALKLNYDEDTWRGMLALIAGYYGDWDLVSQVTGGDALAMRVLPKKT